MKTYFIANDLNSMIKIGRTIDIDTRLKTLQYSAGFANLSILHLLEGDYENYYHKYFNEYRTIGEWFNIPNISVELIEQLKQAKDNQDKQVTNTSLYNIRSVITWQLMFFLLTRRDIDTNIVRVNKSIILQFKQQYTESTSETISDQTIYTGIRELTTIGVLQRLSKGNYLINPNILWVKP